MRGIRWFVAMIGVALVLGALGGATRGTAANGVQAASKTLKDARLKFEINATDRDGGIQVFVDEDSWRRLTIFDPAGRQIFTTTAQGRMARQGGTELFVESAEPPFSELPVAKLLERWPAGAYRIEALGTNGKTVIGTARLTHDLPAGPELVSPLEDDGPQNPERTVVRWKRVGPANGSPIIGYQVLVVQPETGLRALPNVTLDVMMPPTATSLAIPPGFLRPGTEYEWEVLALERGGNQTLSSSMFTTSG
jgi:hypothetical protein